MENKKYIMFAEDENNFIYIVNPIDEFVHDSLFAEQLERGLTAMKGTFNDKPEVNDTLQALLFSKAVFNRDQVENYLEANKDELLLDSVGAEVKPVESKDKEITITLKNFSDKIELREISGVEIFAAGVWNGDEYTVEDLDAMVEAFNDNGHKLKPYLKLGHDENQKLLQKDGLPAAGWIGNIYRQGEKLYADFVDIPKKIFELIKNKAFRKVSSEIYWNLKVGDKVYKRLLSAVSLLGSDMPAVSSLDDILALYGIKADLKKYNNGQYKTVSYERKDLSMSEEKVKELEAEVKNYKAEMETKDADLKQKDQEIEDLKKFKQEKDAEAEQLRQEKEEMEREKFVDELGVSKAAKPYAMFLINDEKKTYTKDKTEYDKKDALKQLLKLHSANESVNFEESSGEGKNEESDLAKLEQYCKDHDCSFDTAYKALMK